MLIVIVEQCSPTAADGPARPECPVHLVPAQQRPDCLILVRNSVQGQFSFNLHSSFSLRVLGWRLLMIKYRNPME